eukprot:scaffold28112_cov112-Isochrysis_galbana.AAC.3
MQGERQRKEGVNVYYVSIVGVHLVVHRMGSTGVSAACGDEERGRGASATGCCSSARRQDRVSASTSTSAATAATCSRKPSKKDPCGVIEASGSGDSGCSSWMPRRTSCEVDSTASTEAVTNWARACRSRAACSSKADSGAGMRSLPKSSAPGEGRRAIKRGLSHRSRLLATGARVDAHLEPFSGS